jgi:hypothetical protein
MRNNILLLLLLLLFTINFSCTRNNYINNKYYIDSIVFKDAILFKYSHDTSIVLITFCCKTTYYSDSSYNNIYPSSISKGLDGTEDNLKFLELGNGLTEIQCPDCLDSEILNDVKSQNTKLPSHIGTMDVIEFFNKTRGESINLPQTACIPVIVDRDFLNKSTFTIYYGINRKDKTKIYFRVVNVN